MNNDFREYLDYNWKKESRYSSDNDYRYYLSHHGILGMKWGKRNGPPYPLSGSAHSSSEKKAGWKKSLGGGRNENLYGRKTLVGGKTFARDTEKDKRGRTRKGSDTSLKNYQIAKTVIDALSLNPISIYQDVKRFNDYRKGKKFVEENNKRLKSDFKIDKETRLKLKDKEMSKDEDMKYVNPEYNDWNVNTKQNCMLCTTAYELRRRGYEVQAKKALWGYPVEAVTDWFPKAKLEEPHPLGDLKDEDNAVEIRRRMWRAALGGNDEATTTTVKAILKQGNGARGNLIVTLSNGGGHSVVYENDNGKVIIRDCQSNKVYEDPSKLLNYTIATRLYRLDNVDFDKENIKEAVR